MYTYRIRAHSSEVIAFEPIPMFNRILRTVFEGKRGRVEPYAVSDQRGTAKLRLPYGHDGTPKFGRSTIDPSNRFDPEVIARNEEIEVETRRIDDYDSRLPTPDPPTPDHLVTTTEVPTLTRANRSVMSALYMRMQP